jgi:hypothetical protein
MRCVLTSIALLTGLAASPAMSHDLQGIVAERQMLTPQQRKKLDDMALLRKLLAEKAAKDRHAGDDGQLEAVVQRALRWDKPVVQVCFLDGRSSARTWVVSLARQWTQGTGLTLDFGPAANPSTCGSERVGDIRVSFAGTGNWSHVGTNARSIAAGSPTLNLAGMDRDGPYSHYEQFLVLHEFGHALGFEHEHQSPNEGCSDEFDWALLPTLLGMNDEEVRQNMARLDVSSSKMLVATAFDRQSVMLYALPKEAFKTPGTARCLVEQANDKLSAIDRQAARDLYPTIGTTTGAFTPRR